MYRTVREGDASLQYTILPQRDDVPHVLVDTMTLRHAVKRRGLRSSCCACGPWGLRSRPLLLLGAVLALGCCAVLVAALLPALASASDLEAALQNAFTLGGAGQTASINPNVHHPAGRHHGEDADERRPHRPPRPARPFSEEDEDDAGDDYPSGGQEVAMVSAPELPPLPPADIAYNAPVAARTVPTEPPFKSFKGTAKARDDHDDDENDDDDDDLSFESRSIEVAARRMHDVRQSAVQPNPPGLPPSLLPQRQPPAAPAGLMLDPMMLGDAPMPPVRSHHKTNNGLYTNEDDLDHNILDIQPQRSAHARASTRIFVEALLPSLPGQGEPEPPQRRSWTPSASFFHWTAQTSKYDLVDKKLARGPLEVWRLNWSQARLTFTPEESPQSLKACQSKRRPRQGAPGMSEPPSETETKEREEGRKTGIPQDRAVCEVDFLTVQV
ncbi:uncharacterized protein LOC117643235 [Thrips palmi]|uniref:Uncharacterized protein LOC117643235 n=1 Tax=Thrips palmi TaxID=161013 RepID=A0A6P8YLC3_THRPL|nr:uncharacterized protein LOC117643235 [Thrips palmi]